MSFFKIVNSLLILYLLLLDDILTLTWLGTNGSTSALPGLSSSLLIVLWSKGTLKLPTTLRLSVDTLAGLEEETTEAAAATSEEVVEELVRRREGGTNERVETETEPFRIHFVT